jgi:hypothetical protein
MENCPICDKPFLHVEDHVWQSHVSRSICWCGLDMWFTDGDYHHVDEWDFKKHCEARGGYLAHYLECRMGGADARCVPDM